MHEQQQEYYREDDDRHSQGTVCHHPEVVTVAPLEIQSDIARRPHTQVEQFAARLPNRGDGRSIT
jgi:hypothetical protein